MIVRLAGTISEVREDAVVIDRDGIGYEVLICGYAAGELAARAGEQATLHTLEYFEGTAVGGNLIPRLVGFLHADDRSFFQRFITVKNLGVRKALKALVEPVAAVATAIEAGDTTALARLPGIGKRAADQIVAELRGKVTAYAGGAGETIEETIQVGESWSPAQRDALEVMVALGERRNDAQRWIERAGQVEPGDHAADEWVRLAYRVRGTEG